MQIEEPDDVMIIYDQQLEQKRRLNDAKTQIQSAAKLQNRVKNYTINCHLAEHQTKHSESLDEKLLSKTEIKEEIKEIDLVESESESQWQTEESDDVMIIHDQQWVQQQHLDSHKTQEQSAELLNADQWCYLDSNESNFIDSEEIDIEEHDIKFEPIQELRPELEELIHYDYFYLKYIN